MSTSVELTRPATPFFRPRAVGQPPSSVVHFHVYPEMAEVRAYAEGQGWLSRGWSVLRIPWLELHYTTDGWQTARVLRSTDVPSPVVGGFFFLPDVPRGTLVELAVHAGVSCRALSDTAGYRERGSLWFNNGGSNYLQRSR
jgi:hypothetical protein